MSAVFLRTEKGGDSTTPLGVWSKTVAWYVFFRVNEPNRHYNLDATGIWNRVPGSEATYGDATWHFHIKTRRLSTGWGR